MMGETVQIVLEGASQCGLLYVHSVILRQCQSLPSPFGNASLGARSYFPFARNSLSGGRT